MSEVGKYNSSSAATIAYFVLIDFAARLDR
jgi:hypothetical protein